MSSVKSSLGILGLTFIFTAGPAVAAPCKIHVRMDGVGYGYGWEIDTKAEAQNAYFNAIRAKGHVPVADEAEADYVFDNYFTSERENVGRAFFPGNGVKYDISTVLLDKKGELIVEDRWYSCFIPAREVGELECGPMTVFGHVKKSSKRMKKILSSEELSCNI